MTATVLFLGFNVLAPRTEREKCQELQNVNSSTLIAVCILYSIDIAGEELNPAHYITILLYYQSQFNAFYMVKTIKAQSCIGFVIT